jgi:nicotinamidase-related amidase
MKECLLIIDAQEAWRDEKSSLFIGDLKEYVEATNKLIAWARKNKIPIIFSLHKFKPDGSDILKQEKGYLDDFIDGNPRAELISDLDKKPEDIILVKNRFSFFSNLELEKILEEKGVKEIIMGGLITNCCVRATAIDAYNLEYGIIIVKEVCASGSNEIDEFTFQDLESLLFGIKIVNLEEIIKNQELRTEN